MSVYEKYMRAADEVIGFEEILKEQDLSVYSTEAFDFEKSELTKTWGKYKKLYEECSSDTVEKKKELVLVQSKHPQVRKTYIRCINILANARKDLPRDNNENGNIEFHNQNSSVPIPPCDTNVFHGDYISWPTFRDMFTAIYINNSRLSPVEKLFYLFRKTDGEARDINRNIGLTAENFEIAWNNLKCQYENKRVLINSQLKLLFNLVPCQSETAAEIKRLQREINNCMSILKLYNVDIKTWDPIFVYQCSSKLSERTLNIWEQSVKNKTEIPSWEELNDFLTDRFHTLESVSDIIASNNKWPTSSQSIDNESNQVTSKMKHFKTHHTKVDLGQCKICRENHLISYCPKFLSMDHKNRVSILRKYRYCFNCLNMGHMYGDCLRVNGCAKCKRKHHTLLHKDFIKKNNQVVQHSTIVGNNSQKIVPYIKDSHEATGQTSVVQSHFTTSTKKVMLATAWVNIISFDSTYKVRALIDPCSDESFISENLQKLLKLPTSPIFAEVTGVGGEIISKSNKIASFSIKSIVYENNTLHVQALVVPKITGNVPTYSIRLKEDLKLPQLDYADPDFFKSSKVDILLGGDLYPSILRSGVQHGILQSLVAQETIFGWVVTGPTTEKKHPHSVILSHLTNVSIDENLAKFWELEEVPSKKILSEDDKICEDIYQSTTVRNSEGRYVVNLPFKRNCIALGPNRHIAVNQYLRNEKSFKLKPGYRKEYNEVMKEYIDLGHMNSITEDTKNDGYYLPHHGIFKPESTTTRLRVVFNASSITSNGKSLNDLLYIGPILQNDIVSLILKWRFYKFVFNADITKMYRQILVNPEHTKYQKIVFRESEENEIQDFKLNTVTFGINCAPYLALRTLLQLAKDEENTFPLGSKILRESMYVDDALVGAHSLPDALMARNQLIDILKAGGFELRKWTSNSVDILKDLPTEYLLSSSFLSLDDKSTAKTLGVRWNASEDRFYFSTEEIKIKSSYTKREVLSIIARLFDPAGWLAPVIVRAKILLQQMWLDKIGWDENIKQESLQKWKIFISNYNNLDTIKIPRWVQYAPIYNIEFHGFCDSSEYAYAANLYVRIKIDNRFVSNLLVAKTKVAPIKKVSLPRLELCGAVLLSKLISSVLPYFDFNPCNLYLWSDSTIVLAWLKKHPSTWKTFVANRVANILENVGNKVWGHVSSTNNPADLATRGLMASDLKESCLWWHGPEWLHLEKESWPNCVDVSDTTEELKRSQSHIARSTKKDDVLERFSCLSRAYHVIAYIFRFYNKVSKRSNERFKTIDISAQELTFVRNRLFLLSQLVHFPNEVACLVKKRKIESHSPLLTLNPFLDENNIIRANGRLALANKLSYNERHPIILAYGSRLARLYVEFIHKLVLHGGSRLVLNLVRQECWILKAKNLIKTVIHNCKTCILQKKRMQGQIMAPLPEQRTTFSRPFTNTGVDFAGPVEIKSFTGRYCKITKGYICLFVCFSTKAIHLEAVSDLSTPAFMAALARFVSRRGCPNKIFSDNGRNFVGAAKQIDQNFVKYIKEAHQEVVSKYGYQKLSWHFIPASAPHMGGLWEAGVKSVKTHFKKIAGQMKYTFEEFSTILTCIEACLNSRPLGPLPDSVDEPLALTPGHFLIGSAILTPPEPEEFQSPVSIVNRWRKVKAMQHEFCRRWKNEYLMELHKRNKWKVPQIDMKKNDLVVLKNEVLGPTEWRLGRVTNIHRGPDGQIRVVDLKTQNGNITRPVHKLVLLPNLKE